jgi:hypothetical protein
MGRSRAWAARYFAGPATLPISFVLDGKRIAGIPDAWEPTVSRRTIDANIAEMVFEGTAWLTETSGRPCDHARPYYRLMFEDRGLIQAIRLPAAPAETLTIYPRRLRPGATYLFENRESGETRTLDAEALIREGFRVALPARAGALWCYRQDIA